MNWLQRLIQRVTGGEPSAAVALEDARGHAHRTITRTLTLGLDLRESQLEVIEHSALVAVLCRSLARWLHLSDADAYILETAAELHELGMFTVDAGLLLRTAPLTEAELAAVRGQARVSATLAAVMHHPRVALLIEHQYADFTGLRDQLDEPDLLLAGVLRVADTIAAVTHPRPYQEPLSVAERAQMLESGAGTRFHPVAVDAALRFAAAEEQAPGAAESPDPSARHRGRS